MSWSHHRSPRQHLQLHWSYTPASYLSSALGAEVGKAQSFSWRMIVQHSTMPFVMSSPMLHVCCVFFMCCRPLGDGYGTTEIRSQKMTVLTTLFIWRGSFMLIPKRKWTTSTKSAFVTRLFQSKWNTFATSRCQWEKLEKITNNFYSEWHFNTLVKVKNLVKNISRLKKMSWSCFAVPWSAMGTWLLYISFLILT